MNKITCNLPNCHGIQSFQHEFDFSNTNIISLYARDGLMKILFSKTVKKSNIIKEMILKMKFLIWEVK